MKRSSSIESSVTFLQKSKFIDKMVRFFIFFIKVKTSPSVKELLHEISR